VLHFVYLIFLILYQTRRPERLEQLKLFLMVCLLFYFVLRVLYFVENVFLGPAELLRVRQLVDVRALYLFLLVVFELLLFFVSLLLVLFVELLEHVFLLAFWLFLIACYSAWVIVHYEVRIGAITWMLSRV
jgi:hypothetical protein